MRKKTFSHPSRTRKRIIATISMILMLLMVFGLAASRTQAANLRNTVQSNAAAIAENVFGVEITPLNDSGGLTEVATTETKWVRGIEVKWSEVEPTQGIYNWSALDGAETELVNAFSAGLTPIVMVRGAPLWASPDNLTDCVIADIHYTDFGNFIAQVITNTNSPLSEYSITYLSIWNEPDIASGETSYSGSFGGCWGDINDPYYGGEAYGEMLDIIYEIVKAADPATQIIAGELLLDCSPELDSECLPGKFFEGVLRSTSDFDGVSFHGYDFYMGSIGEYGNTNWDSGWNSSGPVLVSKAEYIAGLLKSAGLSDKFIMNTEFALLCDTCENDGVFEITKASYLVHAYARAIANGLEANVWFDVTGTWGRSNGLLKRDLFMLPAFYTYQFASSKLTGITQFKEITQYEGVTGYEFWGAACEGDTNCNVWILWSLDGNDHEISLPAVPYAIQDMFGNSDPISQTLTVSLSPIYIDLPTIRPRMSMPIIANCASFLNNLVGNGGLDCGLDPWQIYSDFLPATLIESSPLNPSNGTTDTSIPLGKASALLGDPRLPCLADQLPPIPNDYAGIDQQIALPDASKITLSFSYIIYSQDYSSSGGFDRFEVFIDDQFIWGDGNAYNVLGCGWYRVPGPYNPRPLDPTGQWAKSTMDISSYAGQTITLSFRNYLRYDQWFNTYTYLDNVLITAE